MNTLQLLQVPTAFPYYLSAHIVYFQIVEILAICIQTVLAYRLSQSPHQQHLLSLSIEIVLRSSFSSGDSK